MDQFMKLPPSQKAAVIAAALAVLAVGMYFLAVDPELARGDTQRKALKQIDDEVGQLGSSASVEEQERLRKLKDKLLEEDKENRKMLPAADEIPDFIDTMQADARGLGLSIERFERLPEQSQDLYNAIPIKMVVEGTTLQLIEFLRKYSGQERRVINVRELTLTQLSPEGSKMSAELAASRPPEARKSSSTITPEQQRLDQIELAELSRKHTLVRATFTAYAFIWTGKPAVQIPGTPAAAKYKKKRT